MTYREIKKAYRENIKHSEIFSYPGITEYKKEMFGILDELYKEGTVKDFSNDFLRFVNGYQSSQGEYENLSIRQTYDLRSVTASKEVTRNMMQTFLGI